MLSVCVSANYSLVFSLFSGGDGVKFVSCSCWKAVTLLCYIVSVTFHVM